MNQKTTKAVIGVGDTVKIAGERSNINGRLNATGEVKAVHGKTAVVWAGIYMRGPAELHVNLSRLTVIEKANPQPQADLAADNASH